MLEKEQSTASLDCGTIYCKRRFTDVSEESAASVFKVKVEDKVFLRSVGVCLKVCAASYLRIT